MNKITIDYGQYDYLYVSTTAKHNSALLRLPDREVLNGKTLNFIITDVETAIQLFQEVDGLIPTIVIDSESKQAIDLYSIARTSIRKSSVYTNKPNDLAVEAADVLLQHHFSKEIVGKNILVIGTGNIAFKLALRLAERNAKVFITGRNDQKVSQIVDTINMVIPSFSKYEVEKLDASTYCGQLDAIIPFLSVEKIIPETYTKWLHESSISVDGGIGNFSEGYIAEALKKKSKVIRLDVRIAMPFMDASLLTLFPSFDFFDRVSGEKVLGRINIVAGGVIGHEGSVIVDQIESPQQIIGIANGYGGVKDVSTLSTEELKTIKKLGERIEHNRQKSI